VLELSGPRPSWRGAAYDGWLTAAQGEQLRVLALLGPEGATPDGVERARRAGAMALTLSHPGVLRLLHIGAYEGRGAWCYEPTNGIGLIHLVGSDGADELPVRAAAELVAQVAETLLALGAIGLNHPGPEPADLVLGANGTVRIAGFVGPYPASPAVRAPEGSAGEAAAVYRLGVLLAHLTSGSAPAAGADASGHGVGVRRALIRAMERPGPVLSERYGQWMRGMLAWAPAERPPLSSVPGGLRAVAWATGGEGLADWAARRVPDLVALVEARGGASAAPTPASPVRASAIGAVLEGAPPRRTPLGADATEILERSTQAPEDDQTQEEGTLPGDDPDPAPPVRGRPLGMPLDVGPPPQVFSRRPTLPTGFLDGLEPIDASARDGGTTTVGAVVSRPVNPTVLGVIIGLLLVVLLLTIVLLFGEQLSATARPRSDGPALGAVVEPRTVPVAEDRPVDVPAPETPRAVELDLSEYPEDPATEVPSADPAPARPPAPPAREVVGGSGPHRVTFRIAPGQSGVIHVACAGMEQDAEGAGQVTVIGLSTSQPCSVWAYAPDRRRVAHEVTVSKTLTFHCFHGWADGCLD
jgi:hypothetical protein